MSKKISYKNIEYSSLKALFESESSEGVTYSAFMSRIKNGFSLEKALSEPKHKNSYREYFVEDLKFSNLKDLAFAAGISYEAAVKRSHRGWTDVEIFYGKQKKVEPKIIQKKLRGVQIFVNGKVYENLRYAFDEYKPSCSFNTLRARLRYGWTIEEALEIINKIDGRKQIEENSSIIIDGFIFSIKQASLEFKIPYSTILDRLKRGASPRQAVGLELIHNRELKTRTEINKENPKRNKKEYIVDGVSYSSVAQLARAYNLSSALVYNRIRDNGWTAERAVKEKISEEVIVNGLPYRSSMSAWEAIGLTNFATYSTRKTKGFSIEICLGLEPLPSEASYQIGDVNYGSILEVANAYNLSVTQLNYRLNLMSIDEAVVYKPSNGRYTLNSFKKNPELANSEGVLYFIKIKLNEGVLHKIGITQKLISQRFGSYKYELIYELSGKLQKLYDIEQLVVKSFSNLHYRAEDHFEGRTETFLLMPDEEQVVLDFIKKSGSEALSDF